MSHWNRSILEILFRLIPHQRFSDGVSDFLIRYPFVCTCFFAAAFYLAWMKNDDHKTVRRYWLLKIVLGFAIAVGITLLVRPWISWPAPARNPAFQDLFPQYLWGQGTNNCFPSHSTLAYFLVGVGFWPLRRDLSIALSLWTLVTVSLPRVYLGGHYPIDVLASMILVFAVLGAIWRWPFPAAVGTWLVSDRPRISLRNLFLSIWIFELAEGFRVTEFLVNTASRLLSWH